MNLIIPEELPVGLVHVDLVCKDGGRKVAETFFEKFDLKLCIGFLVVGIPAQMVDEGIALTDACTYLGSEFHFCLGLASDYWAKVWLEDADDAVGTMMCVVRKHLLLLMIHSYNSSYSPLLTLDNGLRHPNR